MEFESPDVIKDFPGLYASDLNTKSNNDSDYSDDVDKANKTGKRKDKKDKKDRGYAALEGESSPEEEFETKSPSKSKKSKSFKFSTKYKEKREKSREKDVVEKKKDKDKKIDRIKDKIKIDKKDRKVKQTTDEVGDIAEELPIFGVAIKLAIERCCCHDEIHIPLPVRACIDYLQASGLATENLYKVSGTKSKVAHIKKLYNQRKHVDLTEYDIYTVTSLLKAFFRELPEPILTTEQCTRFDEAAALISHTPREAHLTTLVRKLPSENRLVLSWIVTHLYTVTLHERTNKMNIQNLAAATHSALQTTQRVIVAFLEHSRVLFPDVSLQPYSPPLTVGVHLPENPFCIEKELRKQESLLSQIHAEMNAGYILKQREEMLWEVQRMITQLKRKLRYVQKDATMKAMHEKLEQEVVSCTKHVEERSINCDISPQPSKMQPHEEPPAEIAVVEDVPPPLPKIVVPFNQPSASVPTPIVATLAPTPIISNAGAQAAAKISPVTNPDEDMLLMHYKNDTLTSLKESLVSKIIVQKGAIAVLKSQLVAKNSGVVPQRCYSESSDSLDEVMDLLLKENQILQIKKINLVRKIMEQHECCIELKAKLALCAMSKN